MCLRTKHIQCYICTKQAFVSSCTYEQAVNALCTRNRVNYQTINAVCTHNKNKICVYTLEYFTSFFIKDIVTFPLTYNFNISSNYSVV